MIICPLCSKSFTIPPGVWRRKHCSQECRYEAVRRQPITAIRPPVIDGEIAKIPLTKGFFAIIDIADIPIVSGRNWNTNICGGKIYATSRRGGKHTYLHRLLTGATPELSVDHINGDTLNNRRANLRVCTHQQNICNQRLSAGNTSGQTGVGRYEGQKWTAKITIKGKIVRLGSFESFEEAVAARLAAEKKYFGEFARSA